MIAVFVVLFVGLFWANSMEKVVVAHRSRYSSRVGAALQLEAPCKLLAQALAAHTSDNWFQHPERVLWTVKTLLSNL